MARNINMKQWFADMIASPTKKSLPVLSFPSVTLMGIAVDELINSSDAQAKGMKAICDKCDTAASVSLMDLSLEAEAFGSEIRVSSVEVPTVIGRLIETQEDAEALAVPAVGAGRTGLYIDAMTKACQLINDRPVFAGVIGPFSLSGRLIDMTEIMIGCYTDPDMVHLTLDKATQFLVEYCKAYKQTGAHGIVMAEPAAGLLSPDLIAEFSTPYVKRIVDAVQDDNFAVVYHNCGNTVPLIGSILDTGAMAYHFGNAINMADILPLMPADTVAMGNISPADHFRNGTPESTYAATTELLNACAAKYPNFVISSGCDIPPASPWENIDSFFKAVSDYYGN